MSDTPEAPKIEFPCENYPIKVVGFNEDNFRGFVIETVQIHVPDLDISQVTVAESRTGKYLSVRLNITAHSEQHLKTLHEDLKASGRVQTVL
ncbi:YbeD family protein [Marinobacterium sp. YM272]|uniref:YbeD family protein n=1 Tax=Marinobacterium sp. YM272 TaxID=3421654 RepID=UPI003D7F82DE